MLQLIPFSVMVIVISFFSVQNQNTALATSEYFSVITFCVPLINIIYINISISLIDQQVVQPQEGRPVRTNSMSISSLKTLGA